MGYIHLHIEVNIHGQWMHHSCPRIERNYTLFGMMAGVCCPDESIFGTPKGLPENLTQLTTYDFHLWEGDAHSTSYLSSEEVGQLIRHYINQEKPKGIYFWETEQFGYLFGDRWSTFHKYPEDRPEGLQDFRFVFWFDN